MSGDYLCPKSAFSRFTHTLFGVWEGLSPSLFHILSSSSFSGSIVKATTKRPFTHSCFVSSSELKVGWILLAQTRKRILFL